MTTTQQPRDTTDPSGVAPHRAGTAGMLGVAVALAAGELLAGFLDGVPSPVSAVGAFVVDVAPPAVKDFGIAVFGTADKGALTIGTAVIALLLGRAVGRHARRWFPAAFLWFGVFAVAGLLAALREPLVDTATTALVYVTFPVLGVLTIRRLLALASPAGSEAAWADRDQARRRFVLAAVGVGAGAVVAAAVGRWRLLAGSRIDTSEYTLPPAGEPAPVPGANAAFDVPGLTPVVVPNEDFYRIDTALIVPRVDPAVWELRVTGMVDNELTFTLDDLQAMPQVERYVTIACVSNEVGDDLVGNAKWQGVRLREVLERAGVQEGAGQVVGRAVDGWTAGFPTELVTDGREPLIALGMNGEPLPAAHGFPARLIVPGLYGYVSATKWLAEIELTTWDGFDAYWIPRGWAKRGPIKLQSRIDVPREGAQVPAGDVVVAGVAWDPLDGVERVEVAVDDGDWVQADLTDPLSDAAWRQWRVTVPLSAGSHRLEVRATNGHGEVQTPERTDPRPDGATGHHHIRVRAT